MGHGFSMLPTERNHKRCLINGSELCKSHVIGIKGPLHLNNKVGPSGTSLIYPFLSLLLKLNFDLSFSTHSKSLTLSESKYFRLFQTERVCRRQFQFDKNGRK